MGDWNLEEYGTPEELADVIKDIGSEIVQMDTENRGRMLDDEQEQRLAHLTQLRKAAEDRKHKFEVRRRLVETVSAQPANVENSDDILRSIPRPTSREVDIYDLSSVPVSFGNPERTAQELNDRAKRAIELARFPQAEDRASAQEHVSGILDDEGVVARRIVATGGPTYNRAFYKALTSRPMTNEEARALSLAGAGGGFAVPFDLDPTIIPTSSGAINPLRQIARVIQINGDEWRGVSSGAITTAYAAEATATTDNAPTLAQPTISTEKAQAFIPFSIEVGMDWPALRSEMGRLLQDSKDELEATKFTVGSGTNEPFGVITGATNTVNATAAGVFDLEDLYRLRATLPPRYQSRAAFMGNMSIFDKVRQFDTAGGAALWETLANDTPPRLLGKPAYEASAMTALTSVGALFLLYGDFSRFVIVDRIGLEIELIPHIFNAAGTLTLPTGQRGLYAFWRNGSKVVDANGFRVLIGLA
jgi:HK97 family phage major capsid protein